VRAKWGIKVWSFVPAEKRVACLLRDLLEKGGWASVFGSKLKVTSSFFRAASQGLHLELYWTPRKTGPLSDPFTDRILFFPFLSPTHPGRCVDEPVFRTEFAQGYKLKALTGTLLYSSGPTPGSESNQIWCGIRLRSSPLVVYQNRFEHSTISSCLAKNERT